MKKGVMKMFSSSILRGSIIFLFSVILLGPVQAIPEQPHAGDLIVESGLTRIVENVTLIVDGNVIVNSGGTLIIRNSDITVNSHYKNQYWVRIYSNAKLLVENSILREGPVPGVPSFGSFGRIKDFRGGETVIAPEGDRAQLTMRNSTSELRMGPERGAIVTLESSYLSLLFWRPLPSAKTTITDSSIKTVHIWFTGSVEETVELSGLSGGDNQNIHIRVENVTLDIKNTSVWHYSMAFWMVYGNRDCRKCVTIRDSNLDEIFAVFPVGSDIKLRNMKPGFFANWNIYHNMNGSGVPWNLTLVNTNLNKWKLDFHGTAEIEGSLFHLDMWGEARVVVENSTIILHHSRGGNVKFHSTVISCRADLPASMRFLYQPEVTGKQPPYEYEFENSTLGPYAALELTDEEIHSTLKGGVSILISMGQVHWFGGTVNREFPIRVLNYNNAPLANVPLTLLGPNDGKAWSGTTDKNGRASFNIIFRKDNYTSEFMLSATIDNENVSKRIGFLTSTPIILSSPPTTTPLPRPPERPIGLIVAVLIATVVVAVATFYLLKKRQREGR